MSTPVGQHPFPFSPCGGAGLPGRIPRRAVAREGLRRGGTLAGELMNARFPAGH